MTGLGPHDKSRTRQDLLSGSRSAVLPTASSLGTAGHSCTPQPRILPAPPQLGLRGAGRGPRASARAAYRAESQRAEAFLPKSHRWLMRSLRWKPSLSSPGKAFPRMTQCPSSDKKTPVSQLQFPESHSHLPVVRLASRWFVYGPLLDYLSPSHFAGVG